MNYSFYKAASLAALSGILYGTLGFFGVKLQQSGLGLVEFLWWRFLFASAIVGIFLYFRKVRLVWNQDTAIVFLSAGMFYGCATALYFSAASFLGTGLAMVLFFCYPVAVVALLWGFENHRPSFATIAALSTIIIGLVLLIDLQNIQISMQGIIIGLLCALFFGIYFYLSQKYVSRLSVWTGTFWICFGNFAAFTLLFVKQGSISINWNLNIIVYLFGIAIISTLLPIYLVFKSLEHLSPTQASLLSVFEPVVTILLGCLALGETINIYQIIGISLIISSVLLIQKDKKKQPSSPINTQNEIF